MSTSNQASTTLVSAEEFEDLKAALATERAARIKDDNTIAKLKAAFCAKADPSTRLAAAGLVLFAHEQAEEGNFICADSIATQDAFARWLGVSKNTAGDVQKKLSAVGIIRKTKKTIVKNRYGEVLNVGYADASMGSYFVTQAEMEICRLTAEEYAQHMSVADFYKVSTNREAANQHQKEQRRLARIGKEAEKMACPNCKEEGIGHLHVHCDSCGWNSTMPMPDDHATKKPKRTGRAKPPTDTEVRAAIAAGDYEPPNPLDLDQLPDERRMTLDRMRNVAAPLTPLRGRGRTTKKSYDIHEEESGVSITLGQNLTEGVIEAKSNFDQSPDSMEWAVREAESMNPQSQIL